MTKQEIDIQLVYLRTYAIIRYAEGIKQIIDKMNEVKDNE